MYVFGIVVSGSDGSPVGRASDALWADLPGVFPKFVFDFVGPEELELDSRKPGELLFRVLAADVQRISDGKTISEEATFEMVQTIQEAVDKTRKQRPSIRTRSTRASCPHQFVLLGGGLCKLLRAEDHLKTSRCRFCHEQLHHSKSPFHAAE